MLEIQAHEIQAGVPTHFDQRGIGYLRQKTSNNTASIELAPE
jgi:hypothetical protein